MCNGGNSTTCVTVYASDEVHVWLQRGREECAFYPCSLRGIREGARLVHSLDHELAVLVVNLVSIRGHSCLHLLSQRVQLGISLVAKLKNCSTSQSSRADAR